MAELFVYGIRHHGPGSARAVLEALDRDAPDALAIEMPASFQQQLGGVGDEALVPPVALVAYDPRAVQHALYYPLARFSPEWVAMRWAAERSIPVHAIDLPAPLMVTLSLKQQATANPPTENNQAVLDADESPKELNRRLRVDPLGELARIAGYSDRERWWERTFEVNTPGAGIFTAVGDMIAQLRSAYPGATNAECKLREAHMARSLLSIEKAGAQRIAVVCGAWHAPVLAKAELKKTSRGYASAKRGLKGPNLEATWIPWTYERLRSAGGYGAGVQSPVWYELLFDEPAAASTHYLTLTARELREAGHSASVAQVVDAVALAHSLTNLRGLAVAGLEEMHQAALGALAEGSQERLAQVAARVESLRTTGRVPQSLGSLPLQQDLEARLKATRLTKPYRDMEEVTKTFDLRKEAHLEASRLLCQLMLLDIPFGQRLPDAAGALGTFKETWRLHWQPDYALRLLAAQVYGQDIREAAARSFALQLDAEPTLPALTAAVDVVIHAGLLSELSAVAKRIQQSATEASDIWLIAAALPPLVQLAKYPSLRVEDASFISALTQTLIPKLAAGLKSASSDVDDERAYEGFNVLRRLQPYLASVEDAALIALWMQALDGVAFGSKVHPLLRGFALRTLIDAATLAPSAVAAEFAANLGRGVALQESSMFVEGFMYSSAFVLLHQPQVLALFDGWLMSLSSDELRGLVPALRRTSSQFAVHERRKLSALARGIDDGAEPQSTASGEDSVDQLAPALREALGGWLS